MMAVTFSQLYSAAAAQNLLPSYLSGSARIAPTELPVLDSVDKGQLGLGRGVAGHDPGAIGSPSWSQEGLGLEILHEIPRGVKCALHVKASNVLLDFCLGVEGGDLGVVAAGDLLDWRESAEDDILGTFLDGGPRQSSYHN